MYKPVENEESSLSKEYVPSFYWTFLLQLPSLPLYFLTYLELIKCERHTYSIKEQKGQIFKTRFQLVFYFIYLFLFFSVGLSSNCFQKAFLSYPKQADQSHEFVCQAFASFIGHSFFCIFPCVYLPRIL